MAIILQLSLLSVKLKVERALAVLLKERHKKSICSLLQAMWETQQTCGRECSGQMRQKKIWTFWFWWKMLCVTETQQCTSPSHHPEHPHHVTLNTHHPHSETLWWQYHAVGKLFSSRHWKTGQHWGQDGWSQTQGDCWRKALSALFETGVEVDLQAGQWP